MEKAMDIIRSWDDIGDAFKVLIRNGMYLHGNPPKNWDLSKLYELFKDKPRDIHVLDIGCCGGHTLRFLQRMKFKHLKGIDLYPLKGNKNKILYLRDKMVAIMLFLRDRHSFKIRRGDGTKTLETKKHYDVVTCISVIEHGVPLPQFFQECHRLLKPNGVLFITTDYNYKKIDTGAEDWTIYDEQEVNGIIKLAGDHGFCLDGERITLGENQGITCSSTGLKDEYTFISLCFRRA